MGCNTSTPGETKQTRTTPVQIHPDQKLLIVGGMEDGNISNRIDIYNVKGCRYVKSIELSQSEDYPFPSHGYSVASRDDKPILYISGGCNINSEEPITTFLRLDLSVEDPANQCQVLADLPRPLMYHKSCLLRNGDSVKVVVASDDGKCFSYCLTENRWSELPDMPKKDKLSCLLGSGNTVYAFVDGAVMSCDLSRDGFWSDLVKNDYPAGQSIITGGTIFTWNEKDSLLYKFDPIQCKVEKICETDPTEIKGPCGMVGLGDQHIFFTGSCYQEHQSGIMEYDTKKKIAVVAGYLNHDNINHQAFICNDTESG